STGRDKVTAVEYIDTDPASAAYGQTITLPCDLLILANTPIEATRLSILSGIDDPSGMLGKNLMFHLQTNALAVLDQEIHSDRGRTSTHTMDAFAGSGPSPAQFDPAVLRGGISEMGGNLNPVQAGSEVAAFMYGERLKAFMKLAPFTQRLVALTLQGEDMPQTTNMVDLDPSLVDVYGVPIPRITYGNHPYELAASAYYAPKMVELLEAIGAPGTPYPTIHPLFAASINTTLPPALPGQVDQNSSQVTNQTPFNNIPASRHIMGTHRMALTPEQGPCDPYGRYWNFDNLYHAGGGLFVTAPGYNVTLTMWALSYWVASAILTGVGGQSSYQENYVDGNWQTLTSVIGTYEPDTMIGYLFNNDKYPQKKFGW
ncbi:MAG: GMC oxidoreductase, partial [Acidimicrobiales bacterium]